MKASAITYFLLAEVLFVSADQTTNTKISKKDSVVTVRTPTSQRKTDSGYYFNDINRYRINPSSSSRHSNTGRIIGNLQSSINRPFKHYGPPSQQDSSFQNHQTQLTSSNPVKNQEVPNRIKDSNFVEESSIASQNDQPFGQHTANYLPPKNQKLPSSFPAHLFYSENYDSPKHVNQQQQEAFNVQNPSLTHDAFTNQQISDAALFLSQNAQAISELYGAPAINENYAPNNQYIEQQNQPNFQNLNPQINSGDQSHDFISQLSTYNSDAVNSQASLEKIQSLEKEKIINQLQQEIINRENSARYVQNVNSNDYLSLISSRYPSMVSSPSFTDKPSLIQQDLTFTPSTSIKPLQYPGFYGSSTPETTVTSKPISPTASTISTTTFQPHQASSSITASQVGTNKPTSESVGSVLIGSVYPQYGGFTPSVFSKPTFNSGGTYLSATGSQLAGNSPTYVNIPLPNLHRQESANLSPIVTSISEKPPSYSKRPTITIPLGSIRPIFQSIQPVQSVQSTQSTVSPIEPIFIRPSPVPTTSALTPVLPTDGIYPAVINPGFIYKPVKVQPMYSYYYPRVAYQPTYKAIAGLPPTNPWSYASSYSQVTSLSAQK